ncbi:unnamed protein product [Fusarium graminearum]|nr:unnamed protein product [Fusarium graminearum]
MVNVAKGPRSKYRWPLRDRDRSRRTRIFQASVVHCLASKVSTILVVLDDKFTYDSCLESRAYRRGNLGEPRCGLPTTDQYLLSLVCLAAFHYTSVGCGRTRFGQLVC